MKINKKLYEISFAFAKKKANECNLGLVEKAYYTEGLDTMIEFIKYVCEKAKEIDKDTKSSDDVIIVTEKGRSIRFKATDLPVQTRNGIGIKAIKLNEGDRVVGIK